MIVRTIRIRFKQTFTKFLPIFTVFSVTENWILILWNLLFQIISFPKNVEKSYIIRSFFSSSRKWHSQKIVTIVFIVFLCDNKWLYNGKFIISVFVFQERKGKLFKRNLLKQKKHFIFHSLVLKCYSIFWTVCDLFFLSW